MNSKPQKSRQTQKHQSVSRVRRAPSTAFVLAALLLCGCELAGESDADFIAGLPVVDLHNDRSFFMTAREIPWRRCEGVQICAGNYAGGRYFFALFRPPPPYAPGRFGLTRSQARRLAGMSHFEYLQQALADLRTQTGIPITRDPDLLDQTGGSIYLGVEGAFLLDDRPPGSAGLQNKDHGEGPDQTRGAPPMADVERMLLELKAAGLSYVGLTWSNPNAYAGVAGESRGLTGRGRELIHLLQRLGIAVDLSHSSDQSVRDVFRLTGGRLPLFFSHSSVRALCDHPRNISDELFRMVKASGGVVGINFFTAYITCNQRAGRDDVRRHIEYIVNKYGVEYVALGGDFDGLIQLPEGLGGPPDLFLLARDLQKSGLRRAQIEAIYFRNVQRVLRATRAASSLDRP
ncbi:MAG: membrane dipeptidase [Leptospirales bacterium]|jgi:hypothetical protein